VILAKKICLPFSIYFLKIYIKQRRRKRQMEWGKNEAVKTFKYFGVKDR
jgi:hypothetical protein